MDTDKIKDFFMFHVEKMVLVVVIGVSVWLIWSGVQKPSFLDEHVPTRLRQDATQVRSEIDVNHNDAILPERQPTFDIVKQTEKLYTSVEPSLYKLGRTWEGKAPQSIIRRQDPVLLAPRAIELTPVATAIAIRARTTSDEPQYALVSLEDAEPVEKIEKKVREPRRTRRGRGAGMDEEMMMDMMGGDEEMMMEDMGFGEEMMMGGESMGGTGSGRKFNSKFDFGMRPVATEDKRLPEPSVGWFIAGRAVVPHKELYEAFELALKDASEYNPGRDTPYYYGFEVQRADVTDKPVDQLGDEDWVKIWDRLKYTQLAAMRWSGFAPEPVHEDYRDESLTMWIPPVLLDDYRPWASHPLVPKLSQQELERLANQQVEEEVFEEFDPEDDSTVLAAPGERGGGGMAEMMGMGMEEMDMDMEMEMGMDGMMMGMMMGMAGRGIETDPVDYKLIRFYDFAGFKNSPKIGRKYVYRIRYCIVDPNFPFSQSVQPKTSNLAAEVADRVQKLMAKAQQTQTREGLFQRWSDWSEPSEPTSLPSLEHYYVGPIERGSINTWKVAGKNVPYERDQPKAKMVASQYDLATGARVPMQMEVTEGTVLSKKAESADVVDPITLKVKKLPEAELVSGTTIVDIDGAAPLQITDDLKAPGLMLLYDQTGKLIVTDEVSDQEFYRIYSYADERGEE